MLQASDNDLDKFLGPRNPKPCLGLVLVDLPSGYRPSAIPDRTEAPESRSSLALRLFLFIRLSTARHWPKVQLQNLTGQLKTALRRRLEFSVLIITELMSKHDYAHRRNNIECRGAGMSAHGRIRHPSCGTSIVPFDAHRLGRPKAACNTAL